MMERIINQIRAYLIDDIAQHVFSGASIALTDESGYTHFIAEGTHTYSDQTSFTQTSLVDIASLTKVLTALCFHRIFQESDESVALLKKPVRDFLPDIHEENTDDPLTIEDLLSMKALWKTGEQLSTIMGDIVGKTSDHDEQKKLLTQRILASPVEKLHGKEHSYQDSSYIALAWILEKYFKSIGETLTYEEIVHRLVLVPLNMHDTTCQPNSERCVPSGVRGGKLLKGTVHDMKAALLKGHAGFFSTSEDLSKLAGMLQCKGNVPGSATPFLTSESFARLTMPRSLDPQRGWWGMGIRRFQEGGPKLDHWYGSYADNDTLTSTGFTGQQIVVFGERLSIVMLTNYHVPFELEAESGDKDFASLFASRKRVYDVVGKTLEDL